MLLWLSVFGFAIISYVLWKFVLSSPPPPTQQQSSLATSSTEVMNSDDTAIKICFECGQGAPTTPNEKVKCVVLKLCTSCEQRKRIGGGVRDGSASGSSNDVTSDDQCAACGKGGDNLKACTACKQVKYCNVSCQRAHWRKHKKECRKHADTLQRDGHNNNASDNSNVDDVNVGLGAVSISDDKLFQDPPPKEDCPICFLPMPYTSGLCDVRVTYEPCCGKVVCSGCIWASVFEVHMGNLKSCCPFCRAPNEGTQGEELRRYNKRMEAGDAGAFLHMGNHYERGDLGLPQDKNKAMEMWNRGADLGDAAAHHSIADAYLHGKGVKKDDKKANYHLELAAMAGHEMARYSLGINEYNDGNMNRAMRHFMIAARAGYDEPLKRVGDGYKWGIVTKEEYESTLRAHKDSQDEMKSEQRSTAERFEQSRESTKGINVNTIGNMDEEGLKNFVNKLIADGLADEKGNIIR